MKHEEINYDDVIFNTGDVGDMSEAIAAFLPHKNSEGAGVASIEDINGDYIDVELDDIEEVQSRNNAHFLIRHKKGFLVALGGSILTAGALVQRKKK